LKGAARAVALSAKRFQSAPLLFLLYLRWCPNRTDLGRLPAIDRVCDRCGKGGIAMYCAKCRRQLYYKDPNNHGWCFTCGKVVDITQCGISHWNLMAVFTMLWTLQV
jgi:hypothetical protein